jgi:hypothetical protein
MNFLLVVSLFVGGGRKYRHHRLHVPPLLTGNPPPQSEYVSILLFTKKGPLKKNDNSLSSELMPFTACIFKQTELRYIGSSSIRIQNRKQINDLQMNKKCRFFTVVPEPHF